MPDAAPDPVLAGALTPALEPYRRCRRWWIACSGGVDSSVLLHATAALVRTLPGPWPPLAVIHINHGLNPRAAGWALQVQARCAALGIACSVRAVSVARDGDEGLEAAARRARYAAFEDVVGEGELLLQAHHGDDQIETLFLRLLRGSGVTGLGGMPAQRQLGRGRLLRPLLTLARADILAYAAAHALQWCEDDSNTDTRLDRNFLRAQALPLLAGRWPGYRAPVLRAMAHLRESGDLLAEYAAADLASRQVDGGLDVSGLAGFSPARRRLLLRQWLQRLGTPQPASTGLDALLGMIDAAADAEPLVQWGGIEVRRFRQVLYALPALPPVLAFDLPWSPPGPLPLPPGCGVLYALESVGAGLRADQVYSVRSRRGGERCHPLARAHSQTLKKLLQEAALPPWWRQRLPLIYAGDELAAVGDLWICRGHEAAPGAPGWVPRWQQPLIKFAE